VVTLDDLEIMKFVQVKVVDANFRRDSESLEFWNSVQNELTMADKRKRLDEWNPEWRKQMDAAKGGKK